MRKNKRTMRLLSVVLTLAMVFSLYLPVGVYADATEGTDQIKEQVNLDYMRNYANELLDEDKFQVDNQEIGVSVDKRSQKVIVNGDKTTLLGSTFTLAKDFNFDSNAVSRFSFDGLAKKGTKVKLGFYLDGATEPFATQTLHKQKKKNDWTYSKEDTFDVSALKLTGKHNLTFKVLEASEDVVEFAVNYVEFVESSIPIVYLDIDESDGDTIAAMNGDELHETECYGTMNVQVPDGYTSVDTGKALKGGSYKMEYIRGRGNSTWGNDKNPYKIKLDKKANVLGMGKNKHWVLLANYYDNSLVRNRITYWLGHQLGMDYTPDLEPVDVVMNGEYLGSYFLAEQVRIGENRIEIDDLEDLPDVATEPEITGGYLLSLFPYGDEDDKKAFNTNRGVEFLLESPAFDGMLLDEEDYNKAQYEYIKDYVQDVENALFGKDFENKNGVSYRDLMDIESAAMYYWIQEFSLNGDAYYSTSSYLYKPRNGKLYWGPLWDFDYVAWGSMEYEDPVTEGFQMNEEGCAFDWNYRLFEDRQFQEIILDKWENALKPALKELIEEGGQLDKYMQDLEVSARYNFEKYNPTGFEDDGDEGTMAPLTYKQEIERLREWITARLAWVDENVSQLAPQETTITFYDDEGNILEDLTKISYVGKPVGILPKGPEKEGYVFAGWEREYSFESLEAMLLEEWDMTLEEYIEELREYMDEEEVQEILGSMAQNLSGKISVSKDDTVIANMALKPVYIPIEEYVPASEIYFEQGKYYAQYYEDSFEEIEIEYQITPFDATFSDLTWESSDESIAKVSEYGTVEILAPGDVIITATAENGVSKSVDLHVYTRKN